MLLKVELMLFSFSNTVKQEKKYFDYFSKVMTVNLFHNIEHSVSNLLCCLTQTS